MAGLKPIEIILILAVILLLFGAKRLPDAARGLGRSLRIFKAEIKAAQDDDSDAPPKQIQATGDEVVDRTTPTTAPTATPTERTPGSPPEAGGAER